MKTRALVVALFAGALAVAQDPGAAASDTPVFRSDVSLVRVDVQVLDRYSRAVTGLQARDFVLRDNGQIQPIRQFTAEEAPVDILFLIDVSGSMRPHVEAVARAARQAISVLGDDDRVALMVFDRRSKLRMPFRKDNDSLIGAFDELLRHETFDGGTDITRGLYDAVGYVANNARKDARRAIVILTDDRTQRGRDDAGVLNALANANAVLSLLLTPDAMGNQYPIGFPGGRGGGGGGIGGTLGTIILGRRMPGTGYPGGPFPGGGGGPIGNTTSAGTPEIARGSGGDSLNINDGSALETTLSRLRQRYALYFQVPPGARAGQMRNIEVTLASYGAGRYPGAELRFRPTYRVDSDMPADVSSNTSSGQNEIEVAQPPLRRRPNIDRTGSAPTGPNPSVGQTADGGGWRRADPAEAAKPAPAPPAPVPAPAPAPAPVKTAEKPAPAPPAEKAPEKVGGWPRAPKVEPSKVPFFPNS